MLGYTYPLLGIFWTMLVIAGFVVWIYLLIVIFADIFRSRDMGGFAKALWTLGILVFPLAGVLLYLVARGGTMRARAEMEAQRRNAELESYIRDVARTDGTAAAGTGDGSTAEQLARLADLRDHGKISDSEYERGKAKILA